MALTLRERFPYSRPATMITKIEHIGIAVKDLEKQMRSTAMCWDCASRARRSAGAEAQDRRLESDGVHIELLEPTWPDSNIAAFIEKRGEGLHHIAFGDDDMKGTLHRLYEAGVELIDREPRPGAAGTKVAFLDPKAPSGF